MLINTKIILKHSFLKIQINNKRKNGKMVPNVFQMKCNLNFAYQTFIVSRYA